MAKKAIAFSPDFASTLYIRARLAERFHRFDEANALLDQALAAGHPRQEIDVEKAALLQATGQYSEALVLRERLAKDNPGIQTLGALATLLAEMDQWAAAESCYTAAVDADEGTSPIPCGQLLFEWGVSAMRRGDLDRAEEIFVELDAILPQHVPGRGHRAEVALARGQLDFAEALITPLLEISDDPEYRATYAEILAARGESRSCDRAKRNVQPRPMSCCWRDGPKPMPIMQRRSSWASAIDRSSLSILRRPISNSATHHDRAVFWTGRCATRSKSLCRSVPHEHRQRHAATQHLGARWWSSAPDLPGWPSCVSCATAMPR